MPAAEVLINTPMIRDLLRRGQVHEIKAAMEESLEEGMETFDQCLFRMVKEGQIEQEEALRAPTRATVLRSSSACPKAARASTIPTRTTTAAAAVRRASPTASAERGPGSGRLERGGETRVSRFHARRSGLASGWFSGRA